MFFMTSRWSFVNGQHREECLPAEGRNTCVYTIEVSISQVFLVLKQNSHLSNECLQGYCPPLATTLKSSKNIIENTTVEMFLKFHTPILLNSQVTSRQLRSQFVCSHFCSIGKWIELITVQACNILFNFIMCLKKFLHFLLLLFVDAVFEVPEGSLELDLRHNSIEKWGKFKVFFCFGGCFSLFQADYFLGLKQISAKFGSFIDVIRH